MTPDERIAALEALVKEAHGIFMDGYLTTAQKEEKGKREVYCRFDKKCRALGLIP